MIASVMFAAFVLFVIAAVFSFKKDKPFALVCAGLALWSVSRGALAIFGIAVP